MRHDPKKVAGALLFVGASQFIVGMVVGEAFYPAYDVSKDFISDLGATCRAGSCRAYQPTSLIFNSSVSLLGLLVSISGFFLWRAFKDRVLTPPVIASGLGALGVGLFPETAGIVHGAVSFVAFFFGGISAIMAYRVASAPFGHISILLGLIALLAMALFVLGQHLGLGPGGMERMIAYPELLFAAGLGGYLMGSSGRRPK